MKKRIQKSSIPTSVCLFSFCQGFKKLANFVNIINIEYQIWEFWEEKGRSFQIYSIGRFDLFYFPNPLHCDPGLSLVWQILFMIKDRNGHELHSSFLQEIADKM